MKKFIVSIISVLVAQGVSAASISVNMSDVKVEKASTKILSKSILNKNVNGFSVISVKGFETDKTIGAPELPVHSYLLQGKPEQIRVTLKVSGQKVLPNVKPIPVQVQDTRATVQSLRPFEYNAALYQHRDSYTLTYMGAFRGTHITRLDVNIASYDQSRNQVTVNTQMDVRFNVPEFSFQPGDYKDYLIISASGLKGGVSEFATWKISQGFSVSIEEVTAPTLADIKALVRKYYDEKGIDFVIILGDSKAIPQDILPTSGSSQTPTDLPFFVMDGGDDYIPDIFFSRIVAKDAAQVSAQLNKSMEFEKKSIQDQSGFRKIIGIASNEGSNLSDNEYVTAIGENFKSVLGTESTHLYQDDSVNSNPVGLNKAFNQGAFWMTYMGHGSGTSWPSLNKTYSVSNIKDINNTDVVKPIIIDVACMNGVLEVGYLGTELMKTEGKQSGVAAYYGGTVNISWHPPAIMATGIASEHLSKKFNHLGEALLAGQLYLALKHNNKKDVVDNMEWYHLQGDPGMNIQF